MGEPAPNPKCSTGITSASAADDIHALQFLEFSPIRFVRSPGIEENEA